VSPTKATRSPLFKLNPPCATVKPAEKASIAGKRPNLRVQRAFPQFINVEF
jgi:hypothetical protein